MGLSLEFHLGDSAAIRQAIAADEWLWFRAPALVTHTADFSLHIKPNDLDLLSESIAKAVGGPPRRLRPSLTPIVDTPDHGTLAVSPDWVKYVATVRLLQDIFNRDHVTEIAERWAASMREKYSDDLPVTDAMRTAVGRLVELCHAARDGKGEVFHIWYL